MRSGVHLHERAGIEKVLSLRLEGTTPQLTKLAQFREILISDG